MLQSEKEFSEFSRWSRCKLCMKIRKFVQPLNFKIWVSNFFKFKAPDEFDWTSEGGSQEASWLQSRVWVHDLSQKYRRGLVPSIEWLNYEHGFFENTLITWLNIFQWTMFAEHRKVQYFEEKNLLINENLIEFLNWNRVLLDRPNRFAKRYRRLWSTDNQNSVTKFRLLNAFFTVPWLNLFQ